MKYRHFHRNGGTYFFTVVTNKRQQAVACISTNSVRGCTTHPTCELRETSKPTCRVCAVRTHTFFGVQTIVSNFQTISNVVWKLLE